MVTVRYPVSVCFCITALAEELWIVKFAGPLPLLAAELPKLPIVPDHAVSLSMEIVNVAVDRLELLKIEKLLPQ